MAVCHILQAVDLPIVHNGVVVPEAFRMWQWELVVVFDGCSGPCGVDVQHKGCPLRSFGLGVVVASKNQDFPLIDLYTCTEGQELNTGNIPGVL